MENANRRFVRHLCWGCAVRGRGCARRPHRAVRRGDERDVRLGRARGRRRVRERPQREAGRDQGERERAQRKAPPRGAAPWAGCVARAKTLHRAATVQPRSALRRDGATLNGTGPAPAANEHDVASARGGPSAFEAEGLSPDPPKIAAKSCQKLGSTLRRLNYRTAAEAWQGHCSVSFPTQQVCSRSTGCRRATALAG